MTVPGGMFVPGGRTGLADVRGSRPIIPKEWLKRHPSTKRFVGNAFRVSGGVEFFDPVVSLDDGFEGLLEHLAYRFTAGLSLSGTNASFYRLVMDRTPVLDVQNNNGGTPSAEPQRLEYLLEYDGIGNSWINNLDLPIPQGALVEIGTFAAVNQNMGWTAWGLYWPIVLADEWQERGWRK